ncbi:MAG: hypothetical protein HQ596_06700 [Candidatus Saganbacteria bacterium]|nr:hypothetical protein [Candidatus Saganbacteria bacterium]
MNNLALVVPTIREDQIREFLNSWRQPILEAKVNVYIVEDNKERSFGLHQEIEKYKDVNLIHLCHDDAPQSLLDCINVKSPCCRQIGFYQAYRDNNKIIVTLDDDVRPVAHTNIFTEFCNILEGGVPVWVDPLLNYRSRGYPVENVGEIKVSFHVGSFLTVPDVDGETQLKYEKEFSANPPKYIPRATIVPEGQLIPVNGGICGFKRELTPYVHFSTWCPELKYRRFDDIWMGIILKRILDHCGLRMTYGKTFVNHIRASVASKNAALEASGKIWNEKFWEILDQKLNQTLLPADKNIRNTFVKVAQVLEEMENAWAEKEGRDMLKWLDHFDV